MAACGLVDLWTNKLGREYRDFRTRLVSNQAKVMRWPGWTRSNSNGSQPEEREVRLGVGSGLAGDEVARVDSTKLEQISTRGKRSPAG